MPLTEIDLNDLGSVGAISDIPSYQLPPEAWSFAENIRYANGNVERFTGWGQVFATPSDNVHFLLPYTTNANSFWLWTSLNRAYVYDGLTHYDITRTVGGLYSTSSSREWNGIIFGGVPLLNNGVDPPQYWPTTTVATHLADLVNWPFNTRVKILRNIGPYLVGFNVTKGGLVYPHMVKWSHPADPGTVPISWDATDPTVEAGENDLPDVAAGVIQDALPLQSTMFIYKEGSIWQMNYVGGQYIFDFKMFLDSVGLIAPRCACVTGDGKRHVFMTQDDVVWHNGNQHESILGGRWRKRLFDSLDGTTYINSFLFTHPTKNEVWICYPSTGSPVPNRALVWNYGAGQGPGGALSEVDGINFVNAAPGTLESSSSESWDDNPTELWSEETGSWSTVNRRQMLLASGTTKFFQLESGNTKDGVAVTATLRRNALAVVGRKRDGSWIVDHEVMKMVDSMWPKVRGASVRVRLGVQQTVDGIVTWGAYQNFDPASDVVLYPDGPAACRAVAVEFSSTSNSIWKLDGYKIKIATMGRF